jgi:phenylpyruvate tautomerase PptA (4-oxalocrotonate tautomerase family)
MPHIRVRSVDFEFLKKCSTELIDRLQAEVGCDRSWFTLERIETRYIKDGIEKNPDPFVEIVWFERPAEVKQRVAQVCHEVLKRDSSCVTVVFIDIQEGDYFENGQAV